jgi:HlyD family secretion protein
LSFGFVERNELVMQKRVTLFLLLLILVSAASLIGWKLLKPIEVVPLTPEKDVAVQVYGLGTLEVHTLSKIGFKVSGILAGLEADHGDRVKKGDILARLDAAEQESRVAKAAASVERAKAAVLVARAGRERARVTLSYREKLLQRRLSMVQTGAVSIEDADEKRNGVDVSRADLNLAESDVVAAEAALKDALAQLEIERVLLSEHFLAAPYDAEVVFRHKELGSIQTANEPLFTLMDPRTLWAKVHVDEALAGNLRVGQKAEIRLRSIPGRSFQGRVVRIDIESDRVSEERRVYLAFEEPLEQFHLGEQTEAQITVATLDQACLVPESDIRELNGSSGRVWVIENGRLQLRKVAVGQRLLDGRYPVASDSLSPVPQFVKAPHGAKEGEKAVLVEAKRP